MLGVHVFSYSNLLQVHTTFSDTNSCGATNTCTNTLNTVEPVHVRGIGGGGYMQLVQIVKVTS